ncbi:MAG: hypothetical protein M9894_20205 [Planctomycetes bacterium]|nr:hypothetical protein [Planctomycetota bacterium]
MRRRPQTPSLVLVALVAAVGLGVWLLADDDDAGPRGRPSSRLAPPPAPRVDLEPGASPLPGSAGVEASGGDDEPRAARPDGLDAGGRVDLRAVDPPAGIRLVRGLVREAATGRPIAGALVTWRYPSPIERLVVFGAEGVSAATTDAITSVSAATTDAITDAAGRFDLPRLPEATELSMTLFAAAPGFAAAALRPGLREEVVFDLERGGTLEVHVIGGPLRYVPWAHGSGPVLVQPMADPGCSFHLALAGGSSDDRRVYSASDLAGDLRVWVHRREVGVVMVEPGGVRLLEVELPRMVEVTGTLDGREDDEVSVWLRAVDGELTHLLMVDEAGHLHGSASEGRFVALLIDALGSERSLGVVDLRADGPPLRLEAPRGDRVEVYSRGQVGDGRLDLVALDQGPHGDVVTLAPEPGRDVHVGRARPGRHALLDGGLLLGVLSLPAEGPLVVDATVGAAIVQFELPRDLRHDEVVRGRARLVPEVLAGLPRLRAERSEEWPASLTLSHGRARHAFLLVAPGRYLLEAETDLGPVNAWLDLAPGVVRVVELLR